MKNKSNVNENAMYIKSITELNNTLLSDLITKQTKELQRSINGSISTLTRQLSKEINQSLQPIKYDYASISKLINETCKPSFKLNQLVKVFQQQYNENLSEMSQLVKAIALNPIKISAISLQSIAKQVQLIPTAQIQESLKKMTEYIDNSLINSINISEPLLQTIAEKYSVEEISKENKKDIVEATEIVENIFNNNTTQTFEQKINCEIEEWKKKKPLKAKVISWVFNFICVFILTQMLNCAENYIKNEFNIIKTSKVSEQSIKKDVKNEISKNYPDVQQYVSNSYRYVNKDKVFIYSSPMMNSFLINTLHKGDVITIINKNKRWVYISYEDKNQKLYYGWINTIYLNTIY